MSRVSADELAARMPGDWGLADAPRLLGLGGGVAGCLLDSLPGELRSPATDNHILSFVVRGERHHRLWHDARLVHDGVLASKSINIVPAGSVPRAVVDTSIRVLHVYLPHSTLIDVAQSTGVPMGSLEIIDPKSAFDPPLINLLSALHDAVDASRPVDRLWRDCICQAVVARVLQRWSNLGQPRETRSVGGLSDRELARAINLLKVRLDDEPTLTELAAAANLSPSHFARAFKRSTGLPPHQYLLQLRIERAKELLKTTELPGIEVAARVGYDDPSYFARLFKRLTGTAPLAYRRAQ